MTLTASGVTSRSAGPSGVIIIRLAGIARSALRPAGTAEFDGHLMDVVADGSFIEAGADLRVIAVEGPRVTVVAQEQTPE